MSALDRNDHYIDHPQAKKYAKRGEYINLCKGCGKSHSLFSQGDQNPEYYTDVILVCDSCGNDVCFELAVN